MCNEPGALEGCADKSERIAQIFQCSQDEVKSILAKHPSLENMSIALLEQKVNLLLSYSLPLALITKNPVPLYHTSHQELSRRLQLLKAKSLLTESNFDYLGCSSKHFDAAYEKISAEIAASEGRPSKCQLL
ncbi:uncharacterized protein LOC131937743 [Physella acuta]|uniref:uncharacterized protein LOC131937743 n=1 Tax=Physella acuta TaxID=109671 RepID=UPI0027DDC606|nr:uncharacterized protein LOC131937743 [Physella acuta]